MGTFLCLVSQPARSQVPGRAASGPDSGAPSVSVAATGTQGPLRVTAQQSAEGMAIVACARATCRPDDFRPLRWEVPPPTDQARVARTRMDVLDVGQGRHLVRIQVGEGVERWQALVVPPLGGAAEPVVVWSGRTPDPQTMNGDAAMAVDVTEPEQDGSVKVLVGEVRRELNLCGRTALLSPRMVDPRDFGLKSVKMQRLTRSERDRAEKATAVRQAGAAPTTLARVLVATGASSATGSPSALTDGNTETVWSEARGGEGRGEFVVMRAPSEVPVVSFSVVVRPNKREVPGGVAPRSFWLATDDRLFEVSMPEDAWALPGARYEIGLPSPIRTSCVALVLDEAYVGKDPKTAIVSVAELTALTEFDGHTDLAGLVGALAGGAERAQAAAALLMRGGQAAQAAVVDRYGDLDEAGRILAMVVMDTASCSDATKFFAPLLASRVEAEREHAKDRIRRCGRGSARALADAVTAMPPPGRWAAAEELTSVAPEVAVERLAPLLASGDAASRRALRALLARAAQRPNARVAMGRVLDDSSLPAIASIDVLRAASAQLAEARGPAAALLARLAKGASDVRTRYLLSEPAAHLAGRGNAVALSFLYERILRDPEAMVRAHAAEVSRATPTLWPFLVAALEDENVRVRDAAIRSLAGVDAATPYLVRRLLIDPWPFARGHATDSLANTGPSETTDAALADRITDQSPLVRARAVVALGARRAHRYARLLRERAEDDQEALDVRVKAVVALGRVCDGTALEMLTDLARRAADPYAAGASGEIGVAAIAALGSLHPADLSRRLEPVLGGRRVPRHVRGAAQAAVRETNVCR